MNLSKFIKKIFDPHSDVSSKRVCGFMGWLVCIFICVWCTVNVIQAPTIVDYLFICSASLLGLDSITGIWKK